VGVGDGPEAHGGIKSELMLVGGRKFGRDQDVSGGVETDEAPVEEGVEMGGEEEAVVDIEAVRVGGTVGPGKDVAGAKDLGLIHAGDGTGSAPVVYEALTENILSHPLAHQAFDLGVGDGLQFLLKLLLVADFRLIGQRTGQRGGTTQEPGQMGEIVRGKSGTGWVSALFQGKRIHERLAARIHQPSCDRCSTDRGHGGMAGGAEYHLFRGGF